ncbi:MAG: adenylate/guanylate cyclase domain-containing protein [Candidatus Berkiella sp.]
MTEKEYGDVESTLIYKNVLQNMQDGVLAIDLSGKIITLNAAAANIFMISEKNYIGEHFTKIFSSFLQDPRNDELNDAILSAIFESAITHHKDVNYYSNGSCKNLLVSSTALFIDKDDVNVKIGMIIVISDITQRQRLEHVQNLFGLYIDPHIASRLLEYSEDDLMKASRQVMTVSFCDMNNFTTLCETLKPAAMEKLMNLFFSKMSRSVNKNDGVIDKFIGDSIMSFWGFPFTPDSKHAIGGCHTALDQVKSLYELNKEIKSIPECKKLNINISIGIATGELIVANVGSEEHKNFTVMGNIVNLAARLVGANKVYGSTILLTEEVVKTAGDDFVYREIDTVRVKGKETHNTIYELMDASNMLTSKTKKFLDLNAAGLAAYRERDWGLAKKKFTQALSIVPTDKTCKIFLERIENFVLNPPPDSWEGVWILDRK